ncbi:LytR family transcriptional attenuator [Sediminihabitans luteus]|uniref:LytR family transcriptional attenuator n=1 Tax=Sediminihabitans luteus TaxID=1138585 RepID=A0A2M9CDG4_9CELL|nr:LCP family protein [Sediminihabitans luteus]PJJ69974.1 LytR family transcriptional attenuator [Sediminihabitans luteus]
MTVTHRSPRAKGSDDPTRGPAHARAAKGSLLRTVGLVTTGVLVFGTTAAAAVAATLYDNVTVGDVTGLTGDLEKPEPADPSAGEPLNVLLIGSDFRGGENTDFAVSGVEGMRSDTSIVAHVSADRSRVELVSIPRDSMVDRPECTMSDGTTVAGEHAMFNTAFAVGADHGDDIASAAACAINTVQSTTGVYIDDYAVVDFAGFEKMIDAIGGVQMCIPEPIDNPKADLVLEAGNQTLDGAEALGFARARYGIGDGSDLSRIGRQQQLLAATMSQVLSQNLLTDAPSLVKFLSAATESLTVSPGLSSIPDLTGLAYSLRGLSGGNITFMTIPNGPDPADPNRVVWTSDATDVWSRMAADEPITGEPETVPASDAPATGDDAGTSDAGTGDAGTGTDATGTDGADETTPTPQQTKTAGTEAFTSDDVTAVC